METSGSEDRVVGARFSSPQRRSGRIEVMIPERDATSEAAIKLSIQLHLARLSLSETVSLRPVEQGPR